MNWYLATSYLNFLKKATNQHGVHSPFVYNLVTKCFYNSKPNVAYTKLNSYRTQLYKSNKTITITDFGAGSKVFSSNKRVVSKMAKTAGTTKFRARLLYRTIAYFNPENILELGTSLGIGTQAMAIGNPKATITSIEGCSATAKTTQSFLQNNGITNVTIHNSTFQEFLNQTQLPQFDFIYIDGNHQKEATISYFNQLLATAHNDSVWVFDDIYWSAQMQEAWQYIKQHPKVTVTIDTFYWGFVFFRKEQRKEDFYIRL